MAFSSAAYPLQALGDLLRAEESVEAKNRRYMESVSNIDQKDMEFFITESTKMIAESEARKERIRNTRRRRR